jgi:sugar phosphate isomerase/epimerase
MSTTNGTAATDGTAGASERLTLHSVSYAGVWRGQARLTLEEFVPRAAALGYRSVMLVGKRPHLSLLDYDAAGRARLRDLLEQHGVAVSCIAAYTDFTAGADRADIPNAEMQAVHVMELSRAARDLGASVVRVFTGYERPAHLSYPEAWERCAGGLRDCARRAADFGVTVAVQNHHDLALDHEGLIELLDQVGEPNCKAAFDAWAPAIQGLSGAALAAAVRTIAPYVVHTTVADYRRRPRYRYVPGLSTYAREEDASQAVPMGEGFVDYRTFFATLRDAGFRGSIAYEICSPIRGGGALENLDACARQFLTYMAASPGAVEGAPVAPPSSG